SKEMTPDLNSLSGDLLGQLLSASVNPNESQLLNKLDDNIKFIDLKKLNLNDLKTHLTFENGKVNIKPFDLKYQDIAIKVGGQHGFDQSMNYNVAFDVPAKYLGSDVNKLLSQLNSADANKITVPVNATITGTFKDPKIGTDLSKSVTNLTTQLVQQQKDKLLNQGADKGKDLINDIIGGGNKNNTSKDSTKTETTQQKTEDAIKQGLNNLLGGKKKKS